jgi:hypothetical protein
VRSPGHLTTSRPSYQALARPPQHHPSVKLGVVTQTETATQLLHRVTSYDMASDWDGPFEHPQAVRDFVGTDLSTLPYFYRRYPAGLPRLPRPRLAATTAPAVAVPASATWRKTGADRDGFAEVSKASTQRATGTRVTLLQSRNRRTTSSADSSHVGAEVVEERPLGDLDQPADP